MISRSELPEIRRRYNVYRGRLIAITFKCVIFKFSTTMRASREARVINAAEVLYGGSLVALSCKLGLPLRVLTSLDQSSYEQLIVIIIVSLLRRLNLHRGRHDHFRLDIVMFDSYFNEYTKCIRNYRRSSRPCFRLP